MLTGANFAFALEDWNSAIWCGLKSINMHGVEGTLKGITSSERNRNLLLIFSAVTVARDIQTDRMVIS
jgi:hypothetical protein